MSVKLLDLTLPTPAENVALDEALLEAAEAGELSAVLRFWESRQPIVVVGRSSRVQEEVNLPACRQAGAPIFRRTSGGAAVVAGPGCWMYGIVLPYEGREHLRLIDELHRHVLGIIHSAITSLVAGVEHVGTCDLAISGRKFSGNAVRCKRDHFLYHGTVLYDFDLTLIEQLLKMPPRQPEYRDGRSHGEFLANVGVSGNDLRRVIAAAFDANAPLADWPRERTAELVASRYSQDTWNFQR
jgi:lipoate---protein ligase